MVRAPGIYNKWLYVSLEIPIRTTFCEMTKKTLPDLLEFSGSAYVKSIDMHSGCLNVDIYCLIESLLHL